MRYLTSKPARSRTANLWLRHFLGESANAMLARRKEWQTAKVVITPHTVPKAAAYSRHGITGALPTGHLDACHPFPPSSRTPSPETHTQAPAGRNPFRGIQQRLLLPVCKEGEERRRRRSGNATLNS